MEFPDIVVAERRWECDIRKLGLGGGDRGGGAGAAGAEGEKAPGLVPELRMAGGVVNGDDMISAYLRGKFPPDITRVLTDFAELVERSQDY